MPASTPGVQIGWPQYKHCCVHILVLSLRNYVHTVPLKPRFPSSGTPRLSQDGLCNGSTVFPVLPASIPFHAGQAGIPHPLSLLLTAPSSPPNPMT